MVPLLAPETIQADSTGTCNGVSVTIPFNDVAGHGFFCMIATAWFTGLTNGTSPTTYGPDDTVTRGQMAAFITRTGDQAAKRISRRAALEQWGTPRLVDDGAGYNQVTATGAGPYGVASDGADIWVANHDGQNVQRIRASDGKLLETWTGVVRPWAVIVANGSVFVTGGDQANGSGFLYRINPRLPAGAVTTMSSTLGKCPTGLATDGFYVWTANSCGASPSVSRVQVTNIPPITTNFTAGITASNTLVYDGSSIWVAGGGSLLKLNENGTVAATVALGASSPGKPVFDGENIWVPNSASVQVVRVKDTSGDPLSSPFLLANLTGNGLNGPHSAAFDGQRVLITNATGSSLSLFRATDLRPLGAVGTGGADQPLGACSDGTSFWVALNAFGGVGRF